MSPTAYISNRIVQLGTRTYRQRMQVASGVDYRVTQLSRLNRDLDDFYELLYKQSPSVTPIDYSSFSGQLSLLLSTVKDLYAVCLKMPEKCGFAGEVQKLGMNYSAIFELKCDLENFPVSSWQSHDCAGLIEKVGTSLSKVK